MQLQKLFIPKGLTNTSPFFYIIQHIKSGKMYAGIKYQKRHCNSDTFMSELGYQTSSKIVKNIIKNEGVNSFVINRIRHFNTKDAAIVYEYKFLCKINAMKNPIFLNMSNSRKTFYNKMCTYEHRKKLSIAHTGKTLSEEHKRKIGLAGIGRIVTNETRQKQSISNKGKHNGLLTPEHCEKISLALRGRIFSDTHKKNLSDAQRGKKYSDERKRNIGLAGRGRIVTEETRKKISESSKGKKRTAEHQRKLIESRKRNKEAKITLLS